jgi:hypothetical protein
MQDETGATVTEKKGYTALIHFHGIGSQRRHEEVCTLVDSIDKYVHSNFLLDESFGRIVDIRPRIEPSRTTSGEHEFHILTKLIERDRALDADIDESDDAIAERLERNVEEARYYEVYWAPIMAGEKSVWRIVKWLFARVLRPWEIKRTPWRERQRLRRATLARMFEEPHKLPAETQRDDYRKMVQFYDEFESLEAQRRYTEGSIEEFCRFLGDKLKDRPDTKRRFLALATAWFDADRRKENANLMILITAALALLLAALGVVYLIAITLGIMIETRTGIVWIDNILATQKSDWKSAIAVAVSTASMLGVGKLISDYLGDIEAWATFDETNELHDKRLKILSRAIEVVGHVLTDKNCGRAVITSHSLGTTIAHDSVLAIWLRNRATNPSNPIKGPVPLDKIEHFITFGSPIDKIEYFFESYRSNSHRYKRVMEALRGDLDQPPFSKNRAPHAQRSAAFAIKQDWTSAKRRQCARRQSPVSGTRSVARRIFQERPGSQDDIRGGLRATAQLPDLEIA